MKKYFSVFLMLFLVYNLTAQKDFRKGYITTLTDETIFVDIYIPFDGKIRTKKGDNKTIKYKRRSLKDYGYLIDGKKDSHFASTAFPVLTYEGYYIESYTGDTVEGYFARWNSELIVLYKREHNKKIKFSPDGFVKSFVVKKGNTEERYDLVDYTVEVGLLDLKTNKRQFCKPEIEGKMVLYKTQFTVSYPGHMGADGMMTGGSSQTYPVYVFVVNGNTYALEHRALRSKNKVLRDLEDVFSDYPELYNGIDTTTFIKSDIPGLVRQYNEYFDNETE